MPDEPSGYELQRSIDALRSDVRDIVAHSINSQAYASDLRRIDDRLDDLKRELGEYEQERQRDRAIARSAKQWAIGVGVSCISVIVAIIAVVGDRL